MRQTYDKNEDTFREWFLIGPCALLAFVIPQQRTPTEVRESQRLSCTASAMFVRDEAWHLHVLLQF